jgi:hypothetical protein
LQRVRSIVALAECRSAIDEHVTVLRPRTRIDE